MTAETYGPRTAAWRSLAWHSDLLQRTHDSRLVRGRAARFKRFSLEAEGLLFDFSRQLLDARATASSCSTLAEQTEVRRWVELMFAGHPINNTEDRPALHVALRRPADRPILAYGEDVMPLVETERRKIRELADALHAGELRGYTGRPITDVVNIGIGGSDLGIVMAVAGARRAAAESDSACTSSRTSTAWRSQHVLEPVDPETTLFVICSKTFTTLETLTNARAAREWLLEHGGKAAVAAQCVAVSTNHEAMDEFGIAPDRRFAMWDWVGGRYSRVVRGRAHRRACDRLGELRGDARGRARDGRALRAAPLGGKLARAARAGRHLEPQLPQAPTHAVLPYDEHLARFPAYLQQLEMESNGKSVRRGGEPVECATCPIIWGEPGSNAQHSFYQLLHQGTGGASIDFLLPAQLGRRASAAAGPRGRELPRAGLGARRSAIRASSREQGAARTSTIPGAGRASLILFERLDPETLGKLVALYEHKVFVQGVIWDINSFDQWGVQLGKRLASELEGAVAKAGWQRPIRTRSRRARAVETASQGLSLRLQSPDFLWPPRAADIMRPVEKPAHGS